MSDKFIKNHHQHRELESNDSLGDLCADNVNSNTSLYSVLTGAASAFGAKTVLDQLRTKTEEQVENLSTVNPDDSQLDLPPWIHFT